MPLGRVADSPTSANVSEIRINPSDLSKVIAPHYKSYKAKIEPFRGTECEDISLWIDEYEKSAKALGWTDSDKFIRIPMYLKGSADDYYNNYCKEDIASRPTTWDGHKQKLIEFFLPADHITYLKSKLRSLRQSYGQSASSFVLTIQRLCRKINPNMIEADIIDTARTSL